MQPSALPGHESSALSPPRRLAGWRRIAFPLGAILMGLAPFVVLECVLRVVGVGTPRSQEDPFFGFSRAWPLFELDEAGDVYRTARCRQMFFGQQEFARKKPEGTVRIFGLGGSTMRGRPYETDTSFLKWLEIELNGRDAKRQYETVNCGGLSYASYRVARVLDEVLGYEPDLIILATGHNEFLEDCTYDSVKNRSPLVSWLWERFHSLRTAALVRQLYAGIGAETGTGDDRPELDAEVNARLDSHSGYALYHRDDQWQREVIEHFELSVRSMVETCRQVRVPLVLVNLGENLRDCPPFKSEHGPGLSTASLQRWQEFFDRATKLEEVGLEAALGAYRKAESIDDQYALLIYRMALCFDRLGEMDKARRYYARAKDLDICPLRMLGEMHERLKRIAADTQTPLLDAEQLLVELSPDEIPGNNCFMDHVHPSIGSHQRIGRALALKLEKASLVAGNQRWGDNQRRLTYRRYFEKLGPAYLANGQRRVAWLEDWACRQRLDGEMVAKDARGHLHLGRKRLDYGQHNSAWEQIQLAMKEDPRLARNVVDYALELFKEGRGNLAEEILLRLHCEPAAALLRPEIELADLVLALDAGRTREAESLYDRYRDAIEQAAQSASSSSSSSSSRGWLDVIPDALDQAKAIARRGSPRLGREPEIGLLDHAVAYQHGDKEEAAPDLDQALWRLDEAIRRNPHNSLLLLTRARLHLAKRDFDAALKDSTQAVQAAPRDPAGYKLRAAVCMIQGKLKEAVADLTKAIEIDPGNPDVFKARGLAYQSLGEEAEAEADFAAAAKLAIEQVNQE